MSGEYGATPAPRSRLAAYMARSALRKIRSAVAAWAVVATPTLGSTTHGCPSSTNGASKARRIRCATSMEGSEASSSSTANSSPPSRATVSVPRTQPRIRAPACTSSTSPAACPSESLTSLKSSRSMHSTAGERSPARSAVMAAESRSHSSVRFARPVSGSWRACAAMVSSRRRLSASTRNCRTRTAAITIARATNVGRSLASSTEATRPTPMATGKRPASDRSLLSTPIGIAPDGRGGPTTGPPLCPPSRVG